MAVINGEKKYAACIGGMLSVIDGKATLVPTTFEWADKIDVARSQRSEDNARAVLEDKSANQTDIKLAEARLKRALVRQSVAERR
jgi:F-type H+-transporting ATPase subunit epsilon